ncbi:hypothetical protein PROFUN_16891, partial [Planoprotostelium fungivorum]
AATKLDSLCPKIVQATKDALLDPKNAAKQEALAKLIKEAKDTSDFVNDAAERMRTDAKLTQDLSKLNVSTKVNLNPEGRKDAILDAAQNVSNAASVNPVNQEHKNLLDIAQAIALEMAKLSEAAARKDKAGMIESAKKIAGMLGKIQTFSDDIAGKCKDPILRERLQAISRVPQNFAVQLKIIAAVKSGSGANDNSAKHQLVTCAQSLCNSVIKTVEAAQSAAIKCK